MHYETNHENPRGRVAAAGKLTSGMTMTCLLAAMALTVALLPGRASAQCSIVHRSTRSLDSLGLPEFTIVGYDSVAISGARMYMVASGADDWLATFDISSPNNPQLLGVGPPISNPLSEPVAMGNYYICIAGGDLRIYSTDDPNNPAVVGTLNLPGNMQSLLLSGGFVFAGSGGHVDAIDVSDPTNPVVVGTLSTSLGARLGQPVRGIMPAGGGGNLTLIDVSDPANLSILSTTPASFSRPSIVGDAVVGVDSSNHEIDIFDISDPANPVALPSIPDPANADDTSGEITPEFTVASGRYFYGLVHAPGQQDPAGSLYAIDFADPAAPVVADSFYPSAEPFADRSIALSNGLLVCGYYLEFGILDVSSCVMPPTIVEQPSSQVTTENIGPAVELSVEANFVTDFRWFHDGQPVLNNSIYSGAFGATLTIAPVLYATGEYTVEVWNADGSETSETVIVAVRPGPYPPPGACCLGNGVCIETSVDTCGTLSGTFDGLGTICEFADCPDVCYGDMNGDGAINGIDTQLFVAALLDGANCP